MLNVDSFIARGSTMVDLDNVPEAAIAWIELLRDGAAVQYGDEPRQVFQCRARAAGGGRAGRDYG